MSDKGGVGIPAALRESSFLYGLICTLPLFAVTTHIYTVVTYQSVVLGSIILSHCLHRNREEPLRLSCSDYLTPESSYLLCQATE